MKRVLFLIAGLALILAGVVNFAAFESHIVKIKAHVESATYTTPDNIDFGTAFPQEVVKWCDTSGPKTTGGAECSGVECPPPPSDNCLKIKLSNSFLDQKRVKDVKYEIYCEGPSTCTPGTVGCSGDKPAQAITPYIQLETKDSNDEVKTVNCIPPTDPNGKSAVWGTGQLVNGSDTEDKWDLTFWVPACKDNYNSATDPGPKPPKPISPFVDTCYPGKEGDSYRWVDMAGAIKFQVTDFSYDTSH